MSKRTEQDKDKEGRKGFIATYLRSCAASCSFNRFSSAARSNFNCWVVITFSIACSCIIRLIASSYGDGDSGMRERRGVCIG